jgi:hypothetical protein
MAKLCKLITAKFVYKPLQFTDQLVTQVKMKTSVLIVLVATSVVSASGTN